MRKCRPSGLLFEEHSGLFKPPRHMPTFLRVQNSVNCSQLDLQWCPDISPGSVQPDNGTIRGVGH